MIWKRVARLLKRVVHIYNWVDFCVALHVLWRAHGVYAQCSSVELIGFLQDRGAQDRDGVCNFGRNCAKRTPEQMRWALGAAAKIVPWRADCLVQAIAARIWLEKMGALQKETMKDYHFHLAATQNAERGTGDVSSEFGAHCWIEFQGKICSGGPMNMPMQQFS